MSNIDGIPPEIKQIQAAGLNKVQRKKSEGGGSPDAPKASGSDKVNVSGKSKGVAELLGLVSAQPEVRTEKVAELKQSIHDGTYSVDAEKLAGKIIDEII